MHEANRKGRRLWAAAAIVLVSASLGMLADWRTPGLSRYAKDWLMRVRGPLPVPTEIAIVAIDEKSIGAFGRFPWPRHVIAKTIETLSGYEPKVIAVDVLFPDPTTQDDDELLAGAIGRAGNVVLAAQLIEAPAPGSPATWLMPMPQLTYAAAGVGHVNVQVEMEGVARRIAAQAADDEGQTLRAIPIETVRVADRTPEQSVSFTGSALVLGGRAIRLDISPPAVLLGTNSQPLKRVDTGRMTIDYIGPAGSFEPVTYSLVDVLHGLVPAARFRGKYVLIGATAAGQGDRVASPFVHQTDAHADEHGALMPGVEVMANAVNTILRSRFYSETSDFAVFLWAALVAALTLLFLERSQGKMEVARHAIGLAVLAGAVILAAYLEFSRLLIVPPLVPALFALVSAAVLGLLLRSLAVSSQLDAGIATLSQSSEILAAAPSPAEAPKPAIFPHGLEWKAQKISQLNTRLTERARFVDLALKSVDDGLIIATPEGNITFANRSAASILGVPAPLLLGCDLFARLGLPHDELLRRVVAERSRVEREIEIGGAPPRRYVLRLSCVAAGEEPSEPVYGIVTSLSDVTRQYELQQTKNDVIALVSHEMRTPLTAIQGMTELLANYDIDPDRRKEISAAINGEVKRLTGMITEYLDITRLESGATPIRKFPAKLETLLQRTLLLLEPVGAQRRIRLLANIEPGLPALVVDVDLLTRALENLLSNAIKYSPDNTEITVIAAREGESIAISVADQGYGIPEDDLPRVFEKFYRVPRVEDAGVPGTGLGLALVREIAELHGGSVTAASKLNTGSTFTLRIPLVAPDRTESTLGG
jgi:signal transduction histidine kinase